jgi:Tfp pilus assembly pilus retraction ATPase PilT
MSFRVKLGSTVNGRDISLRYLPDHVPSLSDLSLPGALRLLLLDPSLMEGGLVLIVAPQGKGKTTTGSAIIRSRLELYGGFANTVEDPCELPMHGAWGKGVCIQREVTPAAHQESPGEGYYRLLLDTLRQFPAISHGTMLYVGEIGDARTAAETLKAGLNGHLVVATMHARSPADAVRRIADLAAGSRWDNMSSETVRGLLAACLRGVVHQHLKIHKDRTGWEAGEITPSILWNFGESSYVGKAIREGASDRLINVSNKQTDWLRRNSERTVSSTILLEQLQGIS